MMRKACTANIWVSKMRQLLLIALLLFPVLLAAATEYFIEAAVNDEKFIINGELFVAKTYCVGWEEGHRVIFLKGSAYGACATATLYNLTRKKACEVWCE
jgi:hypothetical protein